MISVDRNYCYTAFNRKHARGMMALYGVEIQLGANLLDYTLLPSDRQTAQRNIDRALAGEQFAEIVTLGSQERTVLTAVMLHTPILDSSGQIVGASVILEDISDASQAEGKLLEYQAHLEGLVQERTRQLAASEALYQNLFQNMNSPILVIDPRTGAILDANRNACGFYGIPYASLTSLKLYDLAVSPLEYILTNLQKFASGEMTSLSAVHRLPNGEHRDVEIYSGPLDFKGQPALLSILHDVTERKQAERARQDSENRFNKLFHILPLPSAIYRLVYSGSGEVVDWIIEDINDFGAATYGESPQMMRGHRASEYIEHKILAPYLILCQEIKNSGNYRMFESYYEPHQRYYLTTAFMLSPDLYSIINLDITEQKKAEDQLRESEERYRLMFETCLDALLIAGPKGKIQSANQSATSVFGWTNDEFRHLTLKDLFDQGNPLLQQAREEYSNRGRFLGELTLVRKDGTKFPAEVSSSGFIDWRGTECAGIFIYDLSIRRQLEAELRESEERFHLVYENSQEAILVAVPETGAIESANPAAERLFGWSEAELRRLGRSGIVDMGAASIQPAIEGIMDRGYFAGQVTMIRKDGSKFQVQVSAVQYKNHLEQTRSCVIIHDISGRKRVEDQLQAP